MLCDQLIATPEVAGEVPADPVATSHQHIDEVVDHDRDLRSINRLKSDRPTRFDSHDLLTLQGWCCAFRWRARDRKGAELDVTDHLMPSFVEMNSRSMRAASESDEAARTRPVSGVSRRGPRA